MSLLNNFFKSMPQGLKKRLFWNHPSAILLWPLWKKVTPFTMQPFASLYQMACLIKNIVNFGIEGAIVEMGSWRGGCGAFMAKISLTTGDPRKVWMFDSFQGIPEFSEKDAAMASMKSSKIADGGNELKSSGVAVASKDYVEKISKILGVESNISIVPGWFQETVPAMKKEVGKIAILRLDGDIYESTKFCLEELYDQVAQNGYIVIDDYRNWEGCRQALYNFFSSRKINPIFWSDPYGGKTFFRKN